MHIVWVKSGPLHPVDSGGKIRTFNILRYLKLGHRVTYVTLDDGSVPEHEWLKASEYCDHLVRVPHQVTKTFSFGFYLKLLGNLFSQRPYHIDKYKSAALEAEVRAAACSGADIIVSDFLTMSVNVPADLPCPSILFQHNVETAIWHRHFLNQAQPLKRMFLRTQWAKTKRFERAACPRFDKVVAVSLEDKKVLEDEFDAHDVREISTGVDAEFFAPNRKYCSTGNNTILFVGSMDWLPNDDAARFFLAEIFPRIRLVLPNAKFRVVGKSPFPGLLELAARDPAFEVLGRVDDVRPFMNEADVFVVPIRIGGGTRLKIYEALAMEMPLVTTSIGAEGLPVTDRRDLLIADLPAEFANAVLQVLLNADVARQLGHAGAALVREKFGWKASRRSSRRFAKRSRIHLIPEEMLRLRDEAREAMTTPVKARQHYG